MGLASLQYRAEERWETGLETNPIVCHLANISWPLWWKPVLNLIFKNYGRHSPWPPVGETDILTIYRWTTMQVTSCEMLNTDANYPGSTKKRQSGVSGTRMGKFPQSQVTWAVPGRVNKMALCGEEGPRQCIQCVWCTMRTEPGPGWLTGRLHGQL